LKYRKRGSKDTNKRKIPFPILDSVNCQMPVITMSATIISLIILGNIVCDFMVTKIVK
jgi:hypothetical protein